MTREINKRDPKLRNLRSNLPTKLSETVERVEETVLWYEPIPLPSVSSSAKVCCSGEGTDPDYLLGCGDGVTGSGGKEV